MKEFLKRLPAELQDLINLAGEIAAKSNTPAYLVGGFVRDLILQVRNLDLDIVVEGDGINFAGELAERLRVKIVRHTRFGTATVIFAHNLKIDITSAREECYPEPACLPLVKNGKVKDDLKRRDFTINAMSISLNSQDYGKLVDFFGGIDDLRNRKIRVLHDLSFIDDPTRILRAVRFEQRYNFHIEPKTLKLLKAAVKIKMLEKVQPQRLRDELILMLKEASVIKQVKQLQSLTGLKFINPHLKVGVESYKLLKAVDGSIAWFMKECARSRHLDAWLIYFMVLLDGIKIDQIRKIFKAFVFRKGEEKRILDYKKIDNNSLSLLNKKSVKPSQIYKLLNPLSYETILLLKSKYKGKNLSRNIECFLKKYHTMRIHVTGSDLFDLGIAQGPFFKKVFSRVLIAKLDGLVNTKEEELSLVKKLAKLK